MAKIFIELGVFGWAVINNWAGYVTGGLVVALLWLWSTLRQVPISRTVGIVVALFFLFVAFFNAWRVQFERVNALPEIGGQMGAAISANTRDGDMVLYITGFLTNPHGPSSATVNWRYWLEFSDGTSIEGKPPIPETGEEHIPVPGTNKILALKWSDYWPKTTLNKPIDAGAAIEGWCWAIFPGITNDKANAMNAVAVITFADAVSAKLHTFRAPLKGGGAPPPLLYPKNPSGK